MTSPTPGPSAHDTTGPYAAHAMKGPGRTPGHSARDASGPHATDRQGDMHLVTRLSLEDFRASVTDLAGLLVDAVAGGASLGFLVPFGQDQAVAWWRGQEAAVADGSLTVWAARGPGGISGTVGLALNPKPNARHRAEVVKLIVHRDARGHGLGRTLLTTAEQAAAGSGATLLILDTETGSPAEHLYQSAGWTRFGIVPGYAADTAGVPADCSFFYKQLT